jgi:hypothetical protein
LDSFKSQLRFNMSFFTLQEELTGSVHLNFDIVGMNDKKRNN